jgi:hypothetical protein
MARISGLNEKADQEGFIAVRQCCGPTKMKWKKPVSPRRDGPCYATEFSPLTIRSPQAEQGQGLTVVLAAMAVLAATVVESMPHWSASKLTATAYSRTAGRLEPVAGKRVPQARRLGAASHRPVPVERRPGVDSSRDTRRDSRSNTGAGRPDQLQCRWEFQSRFGLLLPVLTTMKEFRWPKTQARTESFLLA